MYVQIDGQTVPGKIERNKIDTISCLCEECNVECHGGYSSGSGSSHEVDYPDRDDKAGHYCEQVCCDKKDTLESWPRMTMMTLPTIMITSTPMSMGTASITTVRMQINDANLCCVWWLNEVYCTFDLMGVAGFKLSAYRSQRMASCSKSFAFGVRLGASTATRHVGRHHRLCQG